MFMKREQDKIVNMNWDIEIEIVNQAIFSLKSLLDTEDVRIDKVKNDSYDFDLTLFGQKFICEVKSNITRSNFGLVLYQLQKLQKEYDDPILLVAKSIAVNLVHEFRQNNINTLDISGNSSIIHDLLRIVIKGQKVVSQSTELTKPSRLFKDAGLRLLFGFLTKPDLINLTYREMQNDVNLSLGAIKNVLEEMSENGFLIKNGNKRILKRKQELMERWVTSYNETLKPKLFLKRMSFKTDVSWKEISLPDDTYWGGEPASNLIDGFLIPEDFILYTNQKIGQLARVGLRPDENGSVYVYEKFWKSECSDSIVPKLLVYADLMGSGNGRNIEVAQRIFENGI